MSRTKDRVRRVSAGFLRLIWKRERFGQKIGGLRRRSRANRKTFLAVPALLRGDLRDEPDLPPRSPVDKSDGVLLLDFGTVSDTQTAENAERRLLFEPIPVGSILLCQLHQAG